MRLASAFRLIVVVVAFAVVARWRLDVPAATAADGAKAEVETAVTAAACDGRDLLADLRRDDPEAHARIEAEAAATVNSKAVLWRIARTGRPDSHLFGTIHVSDKRVTTLPQPVADAYARANRVVLEVADMSPQTLGEAMASLREKLVYSDGQSLDDLLSPEDQARVQIAGRKSGLPPAFVRVAKPWVMTLMLAVTDCERERLRSGARPLDLQLGDRARERSIPVVGLETLADQFSAMAGVPERDQLTVLRASLALDPISRHAMETVLELYLGREIGKVWPLQEALWRKTGFDPADFAVFRQELITKRNRRMRDSALPLLEKGGAFIAVGALHLPGPDGLVALLREAGYDVTAVD